MVRLRQPSGEPPLPPPPGGSVSGVTNVGDGFYRATLTSGTSLETVTVEATVDGVVLAQTPSVTYAPPVAGLVVTAPAGMQAGGAVSLTVRAVDGAGNPAAAYRATLRLDTSDPEASIDDTTVSMSGGQATFPNVGFFRSAGTFRITAEDTARPAIRGESGDVAVSPGAPSQIRAVFGDFQSGDAGTWLPDPLRAHLEDAFGNAIPGVDLVFAALTGDEAISTTLQGLTST